MQDILKQIQREVEKEASKLVKSFERDLNRWINEFIELKEFKSEKIELKQESNRRFAEVLYNGELVAYVTLKNEHLQFHEIV